MDFLWSIIVGALALYGASVLINKYPVYATHKRVLAWAQDDAKVKHLASCSNFAEWLMLLSDDALHENDIQLAIEASLGACQAPVGYLHTERSRKPLRELGIKLRQSWQLQLSREAVRRAAARQRAA